MRIADAVGTAFDPALLILGEDSIGIVHKKTQSDGAHLVFVLELHVELDLVTAESDIIGCFGVVLEDELKAKSLGLELDGAFDVACANYRMGLSEHGDSSVLVHDGVVVSARCSATARPTAWIPERI